MIEHNKEALIQLLLEKIRDNMHYGSNTDRHAEDTARLQNVRVALSNATMTVDGLPTYDELVAELNSK